MCLCVTSSTLPMRSTREWSEHSRSFVHVLVWTPAVLSRVCAWRGNSPSWRNTGIFFFVLLSRCVSLVMWNVWRMIRSDLYIITVEPGYWVVYVRASMVSLVCTSFFKYFFQGCGCCVLSFFKKKCFILHGIRWIVWKNTSLSEWGCVKVDAVVKVECDLSLLCVNLWLKTFKSKSFTLDPFAHKPLTG